LVNEPGDRHAFSLAGARLSARTSTIHVSPNVFGSATLI
jgi:hypothetical protein